MKVKYTVSPVTISRHTNFWASISNLIFQYLLRSDSPGFKQIVTKIQSVAPQLLDSASCDVSTEPPTVTLSRNLELCSYHSPADGLRYWCLQRTEIGEGSTPNPVEPFVFLQTVDTILNQYFGKDVLKASKITKNYDRVTLLFNSMVDAGEPDITDLNRLKEIVPLKNNFARVINSTASSIGKTISNAEGNQMFSKHSSNSRIGSSVSYTNRDRTVPWRSAGVKYTNNELYVDMAETVNVILAKTRNSTSLVPISGTIDGEVGFKCYLSENPLVELDLNTNGHDLGIPAFHRCVRTEGSDFHPGTLRFIPPDGDFCLMEYNIDLNSLRNRNKILSNLGLVGVDYHTGLGPKKDEFEIKVTVALSRNVKHVEDLKIDVHFDPLREDGKIKILRNTHGGFENGINNKGTWTFDKETPVGVFPVLRGCIEGCTEPTWPKYLSMSYSNKGQLPSGIRVNSVNILSGFPAGVKPFKGVKYITKIGDYVVR